MPILLPNSLFSYINTTVKLFVFSFIENNKVYFRIKLFLFFYVINKNLYNLGNIRKLKKENL